MSKQIKSLCVISPRYPTKDLPVHTFIDQLICEIVDKGVECHVISPFSVTNRLIRKVPVPPLERERVTKTGKTFSIYFPRHISLSHKILGIRTSMITYINFRNSVIKEYKDRKLDVDAIYGHFVYPSGLCAADLGDIFKIPSFLGYGESSVANFMHMREGILKDKLSKMAGIVSVSTENKKALLDTGLVNDEKSIGVFPNGIDNSKFFKMDRDRARESIGVDKDKFLIVFVGHFIERKGVNKLSKALKQVDDVYSVFIGSGPLEPNNQNIIFKGRTSHDKVHLYLNAADVFVLPTLAEGCCNAIVEAMACGLPIISSNLPFNDDILNEDNSIRIDSCNVAQIVQAIKYLKDNPDIRDAMSNASLEKAKELNITNRADRILNFMEKMVI